MDAELLTEPQRSELEQRWVEDEANPEELIDWEEVRAATLARLRDSSS